LPGRHLPANTFRYPEDRCIFAGNSLPGKKYPGCYSGETIQESFREPKNCKICISKLIFLTMGSFHVKQAKIKQKCHPGSRISKLIFFVDSLKRLLFGLDHFELYDYFLAKKGKIYKMASKNVKTSDFEFKRDVILCKIEFGQNQYFFPILYSISRKSLIDRFSVKWQTNILEQISVF
jgi:hypothetical protein